MLVAMNAQEMYRRQYLDALGVTRWEPRGGTAASVAEPVPATSGHSITPDIIPSEPVAPRSPSNTSVVSADWMELEATVSSCTKCSLHATRTQTVFGAGNRSAQWMFIGEAPGRNEDLQGKPFVGRAGDIFDKLHDKIEYMPIDISEILKESSKSLQRDYDNLQITGIVDTYEKGLRFLKEYDEKPNLIVFLGSSFGNFCPDDGFEFLEKINKTMKESDLFLIGLDITNDGSFKVIV